MLRILRITKLDHLHLILHIYKSNNNHNKRQLSLKKNVENLLKVSSNLNAHIKNIMKISTDLFIEQAIIYL